VEVVVRERLGLAREREVSFGRCRGRERRMRRQCRLRLHSEIDGGMQGWVVVVGGSAEGSEEVGLHWRLYVFERIA